MFTGRTKLSLAKAVLTKRTPVYVQYAVTNRCNFRCKMCDSSISRKEERELNLAEIEKIAGVLDKMNAGVILLTGGEPFIRDDIAEIIGIFSRKGFTVRLQTNGLLATEDKIRSAYRAGMREVTVSLDSLDSEKNDYITGQAGSWHKIIEAISRFSRILPYKGSMLGINIVVCKKNLEEIPDIIKFVSKIGFYASLIPIHLAPSAEDKFIIRSYAPELAFGPEDHDKIGRIYGEVIRMKRSGYSIYNSYYFLRNSPSFLKGRRVAWKCDSPNLYFAISPSGNFLPCVDIKTSVSMLSDDFMDLWKSKSFRSEIEEKVKKCSGCFYACWPEISFLCRNPLVFLERAMLGLKVGLRKRKPVSYKECLGLIDSIKRDG